MIKTKAQERKMTIGSHRGEYRFVVSPEFYAPLKEKKVVAEAALRSGLTEGVVRMAYEAIAQVISAWVTEGHSIPLPGLGNLRFGMRTQSVATADEVKSNLIKRRRLVLVPNQEIRDRLAGTGIQITILDRNGQVIKRVTSTNGEVDSEETDIETPDNGSIETPDNGSIETPGNGSDETPSNGSDETPGNGGEEIGGGI